jgi:hypothetical protein
MVVGQNYTTTEKGTLKTERAKGHVLCTGRAIFVHVPVSYSYIFPASWIPGTSTCLCIRHISFQSSHQLLKVLGPQASVNGLFPLAPIND